MEVQKIKIRVPWFGNRLIKKYISMCLKEAVLKMSGYCILHMATPLFTCFLPVLQRQLFLKPLQRYRQVDN